jgi:exopolyphosphatase/guanosine-5'-triphosphate,3'-diphosphate pyrophosphatase
MPRFAAIDIGTNTVLLCVADYGPAGLQVVLDRSIIARLGQGVDASGRLRGEAISRTLNALEQFIAESRTAGAREMVAVGTAALREARDAETFVDQAKARLGIDVKIISGDEEAALVFEAVARGREESGEEEGYPLLVMDIGGGSTEFILGERRPGERRMIRASRSLPIGSVRLTERFLPDDPVKSEQLEALKRHIRGALASLPEFVDGKTAMVGVAGTNTTLAAMKLRLGAYDAAAICRTRLSIGDVESLIETLAGKSVAERRQMAGLEPGRADVILAGAVLAREGLARFGMNSMAVSDRGLRHGVIYRLAENGRL